MTLRLCGIEGSTVDGLYVAYCNNNVIFDPSPLGNSPFFPGCWQIRLQGSVTAGGWAGRDSVSCSRTLQQGGCWLADMDTPESGSAGLKDVAPLLRFCRVGVFVSTGAGANFS